MDKPSSPEKANYRVIFLILFFFSFLLLQSLIHSHGSSARSYSSKDHQSMDMLVNSLSSTNVMACNAVLAPVPFQLEDLQKLYIERCSICHSLSKSNYSSHILPSDWKACIASMAALPRSNLSTRDQQLIYEYLVYDSATRRKAKLERQLSSLSSKEKAAEKAEIQAILKKYRY